MLPIGAAILWNNYFWHIYWNPCVSLVCSDCHTHFGFSEITHSSEYSQVKTPFSKIPESRKWLHGREKNPTGNVIYDNTKIKEALFHLLYQNYRRKINFNFHACIWNICDILHVHQTSNTGKQSLSSFTEKLLCCIECICSSIDLTLCWIAVWEVSRHCI